MNLTSLKHSGALFAAIILFGWLVSEPAQATLIYNNWNAGGVQNNPQGSPVFTLSGTWKITTIQDYHWNGGSGETPGTISIYDNNSSVLLGTWAALAGGGGYGNTLWVVNLNVILGPGAYRVEDSGRYSWSWNGSSVVGFSQVYADAVPVPEPATMIAGALLLLPFGASIMRMLRNKQ